MRLMSSLLVPCVLGVAVSAHAQQAAAGKLAIDWAVPESPAFTVLGLTSQTVTRPSTAQQLATSLLNGIDQNGNFQSGVAIDVQPYMLSYGRKVSWMEYRDHSAVRFLSRMQLSIATAKGASEGDKSARLAAGVRVTLFDLGDPYRDEETATCLATQGLKVLDSLPPPPGPFATPAERTDYDRRKMAALTPLEETCRVNQAADYRRTRWNNSSLIAGYAPSAITETGDTNALKWDGAAAWASLGYGFENVPGLEDSSQLIVHYRRRTQERLPDSRTTGRFFSQDSDVIGIRWRLGTADTTGSFEYVFLRRHVRPQPIDDSSRLSLALERHISGNTWLSVAFGSDRGRQDGSNKAFVLSSFNWSLNQKTE
jgi:hypothetical protein